MTKTKKEEAPATPVEKKIIKGKHTLSSEEKVSNSEELADAMQEKETLDTAKKEAVSGFTTKIAKQDEIIKACLDKIRTGEEDRDYECRVERNYESKTKSFVDIESSKVIKTVPFTASDFQHEIGQNNDELLEEKSSEGSTEEV